MPSYEEAMSQWREDLIYDKYMRDYEYGSEDEDVEEDEDEELIEEIKKGE